MSENKNKNQLIFIFLTVFIYLLGFGIVIPITPILSRDLGGTAEQMGLLMASYSFMQFLFSPFWGRLSDRYGRRPILLFCMLCEGLSYLLYASARSLEMLFAARILAGFFGASISTASAYISDITPTNERSKGMAIIGVSFGLGFIFGPAIGGGLSILADQISSEKFFSTSFAAVFVSFICFLNFLFGYKYLKESLVTPLKNERKESRFKIFWQKLSVKTLGPLMFIYFLQSLAMGCMDASLVWFMADKFSWGIKEISFGFAYIGIMLVVTQGLIVRKLLPRLGERYVLPIGLVCFIIGMAGIAWAPSIPLMGVTMTFLAIGHGLNNPSIMGSISLVAPDQDQGMIMGVAQSFSSLGRILGPAIGGIVYASFDKIAPFLTSSFAGLVSLVIVSCIFANIPMSGRQGAL